MVDQDSVRAIRRAIERTSDRINRRYGGIVDRIRQNFVVELSIRTVRELSEDDVTHMAAGVAYYALFSIFPLLLGLISIMSFLLEPEEIQTLMGDLMANFLPGSEQFVRDNVDAVIRLRGALGLMSLLGMLWSASAMFGALNRAINRAWDIPNDRPIYIGKPRQLLMALSVGMLFSLSVASATIARTSEQIAQSELPIPPFLIHTIGELILQALSLSLMIIIFLLMYKLLPNTRTYWRYVWPGAVTSAVLFEISKNFFILYLDSFASYQNVYGSIAPVIVLLFWTYVGSLIVLLGAEICSEYERMKNNVDRGVVRHQEQQSSEVPAGSENGVGAAGAESRPSAQRAQGER
jgi:membrane protein